MFELFLGVGINVVSSWAYFDYRRSGKGGIGRFIGFWMGFPWTALVIATVPEGRDRHLLEASTTDEEAFAALWDEMAEKKAQDERARDAGRKRAAELSSRNSENVEERDVT